MKYCEHCGSKLEKETAFCPNCGAAIKGKKEEVSGTVVNNNGVETKVKDNTTTAFVLSLIGALCCTYVAIPGLIMSILALRDMKEGKISSDKKWMAIAGIILSCIGLVQLVYNFMYPQHNQELIDKFTKSFTNE